jgi:type I restriction enzyme M protein
MISKMKPVADNPNSKEIIEGGSRIAIILSGSPLFSGQAGSGESEIRKWIIENDLLEGIVAMPDQMFYNTGIGTYIWIISNRKDKNSQGEVRLIDARELGTKMRKSLGDKRKELTQQSISEITELYSNAGKRLNDPRVKIMKNEDFGYARFIIERPLRMIWKVSSEIISQAPASIRSELQKLENQSYQELSQVDAALKNLALDDKQKKAALKAISTTDPSAEITLDKKNDIVPDPDLRDAENVPLPHGYLELEFDKRHEVLLDLATKHLEEEISKFTPDAWIDFSKTKIGYEIPFIRQFFKPIPPRSVDEVRAEVLQIEAAIKLLLEELK